MRTQRGHQVGTRQARHALQNHTVRKRLDFRGRRTLLLQFRCELRQILASESPDSWNQALDFNTAFGDAFPYATVNADIGKPR